ncbi:MAG: hypothetical protein EXX96DRAFT_465773, partial [Benjaminiella poitrasii]
VPAKKTKAASESLAKETPVKKTTNEKEKSDASAGSKRKRVTFNQSEKKTTKASEEEPAAKKTATSKKKNAKKTVAEEEDSSDEELIAKESNNENEQEDEELTEEQEEALRKEILGDLASSSEGEDSSDEDDEIDKNEDLVKLDGKKLEESKAETKKTFDKKSAQSKVKNTEETGVIYLGRIPHGFYEKEMNGYFSQFGDITRLRLSRNKKTGKPKHYAFIEFASKEVAEIVAETMHNYLLMGHMLQCKTLDADKIHENLFNGANRIYKPFNYQLRNRQLHNKKKTPEEFEAKIEKIKETEKRLRQRITDAGIDYDFPSF